MSVSIASASARPHLVGDGGELIEISVAVEPHRLESLLDCLSSVSFPINPELHHGVPTVVTFPAYEGQLAEVRHVLRSYGFDPAACLHVSTMLEKLAEA